MSDWEMNWPPMRQAPRRAPFAVGGGVTPGILWEAYGRGAFPWAAMDGTLEWWCPDPRCVLELDELRISDSLRRERSRVGWTFTCDTAFAQVIEACATVRRKGQPGTWILPELKASFLELHAQGRAHSVEAWWDGQLVGGLYGLQRGAVFFGESMFHLRRDASKLALWHLTEQLRARDLTLLDCQVPTGHLLRLGAWILPRTAFLDRLERACAVPLPQALWE